MINESFRKILDQYQCIYMDHNDSYLNVFSCKNFNEDELEELEFLLNTPIRVKNISEAEFQALLSAGDNVNLSNQSHCDSGNKLSASNYLNSFENNGSIIQLVDATIHQAINDKASDIHFEPYETFFRVRYRIDGVLVQVNNIDNQQKSSIIARLKIMAELDIAEKRRPQDGRIRVKNKDQNIDIRVSTLPTDYGEKVVLRILDKSTATFDLMKLGFGYKELELVKQSIQSPFGIVLVTGPTGSGKSTTLYSILKELNKPELNIVTIEDPIEYNVEGINQSHVRSDIGYTFSSALRSFLRQDPDVIMVGEIRDSETAEMAVRASLTGHLVLSTIHTNNAPGTITRLIDMGIEPFLISAATKLVIAQRLVRVLCDHCKKKSVIPDEYKFIHPINNMTLHFVPMGCPQCRGTGYRGRCALYEIFVITQEIEELINKKASALTIRDMAIANGMKTLREQGYELIQQGKTSISEVIRETSL